MILDNLYFAGALQVLMILLFAKVAGSRRRWLPVKRNIIQFVAEQRELPGCGG